MESSIDSQPPSASLSKLSFVIPAAGKGSRMGADVAKQYLLIKGKPILQHTLERIAALQPGRIILVVAEDDSQWGSIEATAHCGIVTGGKTRSDSVLNGLNALDREDTDWVMVHDCARPCVRSDDIIRLYDELKLSPIGGLLGMPVVETLKKVIGQHDEDSLKTGAALVSTNKTNVVKTIPREQYWLAQTPQMFRLGMLRSALRRAKTKGWNVTDEASAMEMSGHTPIMVAGSKDNIKITTAEDLALAEYFLQQQSCERR